MSGPSQVASTVDPGDRLRLVATGDFDDLARRATPFLAQREAENCLILGSLSRPAMPGDGRTLVLVASGERVVGAAVGFPSAELLIAAGTPRAALPLLVDDLVRSTRAVVAVVGPPVLASRFAAAWARVSGLAAALTLPERVYRLETVREVRRVAGAVRRAGRGDRALLARWLEDFAAEALRTSSRATAEALADRYLAGPAEATGMFLWEVEGEPVSMAGIAGPTPRGIRVNGVYTPPARRRRGYAGACVAAVSRAQLAAGRRYCFLFTDRRNATADHVYRDIGYEPLAEIDRYAFT